MRVDATAATMSEHDVEMAVAQVRAAANQAVLHESAGSGEAALHLGELPGRHATAVNTVGELVPEFQFAVVLIE